MYGLKVLTLKNWIGFAFLRQSVISVPPVYTQLIYSNYMNVKYTFFDFLCKTMQCLDMPYKSCSINTAIRNAIHHSRRMRMYAPWESVLGQGTAYQKTECWLRLKCDGTRAETRFRLSVKRMSPFKQAGASVQSTTGSRGVRISGSDAGYTMFRGSVKSTGYPLHSQVSPSLPLPWVTGCHHISAELYHFSKGYVCAQCVAHNLNLADSRPDDQIRDTSWNVVTKSRIHITNIIAT